MHLHKVHFKHYTQCTDMLHRKLNADKIHIVQPGSVQSLLKEKVHAMTGLRGVESPDMAGLVPMARRTDGKRGWVGRRGSIEDKHLITCDVLSCFSNSLLADLLKSLKCM